MPKKSKHTNRQTHRGLLQCTEILITILFEQNMEPYLLILNLPITDLSRAPVKSFVFVIKLKPIYTKERQISNPN